MINRPEWAEKTPAMKDYYDHYWGLAQHDERRLFEMLCLECLQSGLNWALVWQKRPALLKAYQGFDPEKLAQFGEKEVAPLLSDPALIRNRLKVKAILNNARILTEWYRQGKSLNDFTWSFTDGKQIRMEPVAGLPLPAKTPLSERVAEEFKRAGFKFTGPVVVMSYLLAVGVINARNE
ncbi:MAG: DNA-3-methyladenine glycosylase I [Limosilactobacillus gorillae]|jgi:DNA-3-methyladenine glycosylase I|uniref:DNA-3-methyladenine glycosylase I n=1 Tax=Limosilactobacillus gorillae TaxID=1450649 RepID=UPI000AF1415E|nr:DNA-3-methyladenine glycosylase I [Limosilactobacillus gorillae]MDO4855701.1 DNA-3-methyladenine glycosylase I [Limosilactobacillus gorillae]